jgi:hypothetical protein
MGGYFSGDKAQEEGAVKSGRPHACYSLQKLSRTMSDTEPGAAQNFLRVLGTKATSVSLRHSYIPRQNVIIIPLEILNR